MLNQTRHLCLNLHENCVMVSLKITRARIKTLSLAYVVSVKLENI